MKRRHGVYFVDDSRDAVTYDGPHRARRYLDKLKSTLPLDTNFCEVVLDFAEHRLHLTRFCVDVFRGRVSFNPLHGNDADVEDYDGDDAHSGTNVMPMTRDQVFDYVWRTYVIAHRRSHLLQGEGIAEAARAMWSLFMYFYRYMRGTDHRAYQALRNEADKFDYCRFMEEVGTQIMVSTERVGDYSVHTHWQAVTALVPTLYELPYSPAMYDYVHALLLRHAQILAGGSLGISPASDAMFDSPLYCDRTKGRLFYVDSAHPDVRVLNDLYLAHAEILFGPQLVRLNRVRWLLGRATHDGTPLDTSAPSQTRANALAAFITRIATDDILRRFVVDPMREKLLRTHLMHGERTRFMRLHPTQEAEPDNILATLRHNDYSETPELFNKPVGDIASAFAASSTADVASRPYAARPRPENEREVLLASFITLNTWMIYRGAPRDFVEARLHFEEMHVGMDELADPFILPTERPALVRVMRWHFVIDVNERIVYAGTNLLGALGVWLQQVRDEAAKRLKLELGILHELLAPLLSDTALVSAPSASTSGKEASGAGVTIVSF